jgi:Ca2+-transporting ATPase
MVLLDDNFASIVGAVREGRRIYDNIRKFLQYILSTNTGEVVTLLFAPLLGMPIPLLPIHILFINLLTDGIPALALTMEPADRNVMQRPPIAIKNSLFANGVGRKIVGSGLLIGITTLLTQSTALALEMQHWQSMVFTVLTFTQFFNVMSVHAGAEAAIGRALWRNALLLASVMLCMAVSLMALYLPWANALLKTQPLTLQEMGICIAFACIPFVIVELGKWQDRKFCG